MLGNADFKPRASLELETMLQAPGALKVELGSQILARCQLCDKTVGARRVNDNAAADDLSRDNNVTARFGWRLSSESRQPECKSERRSFETTRACLSQQHEGLFGAGSVADDLCGYLTYERGSRRR